MHRITLLSALGGLLLIASLAGGGGIPEPGLTMYGKVIADINGSDVRLTWGELAWTIRPASGAPITVRAALTNLLDQFCYVVTVPFETCLSGMSVSSNALKIT